MNRHPPSPDDAAPTARQALARAATEVVDLGSVTARQWDTYRLGSPLQHEVLPGSAAAAWPHGAVLFRQLALPPLLTLVAHTGRDRRHRTRRERQAFVIRPGIVRVQETHDRRRTWRLWVGPLDQFLAVVLHEAWTLDADRHGVCDGVCDGRLLSAVMYRWVPEEPRDDAMPPRTGLIPHVKPVPLGDRRISEDLQLRAVTGDLRAEVVQSQSPSAGQPPLRHATAAEIADHVTEFFTRHWPADRSTE